MTVNSMDLLSLEELQQDSPLFRAKTYDLLRRADRLATSCQAVLRHSNEVSSRRRQLHEARRTWQSSVQQLDHILAYHSNQEDTCAARERRSDDEIEAWQTKVDEPVHCILANCEKVRNASKSFEGESQGFYAATGRWLAEVRSSDQQQQKGRNEEQQAIRELRFLLARYHIHEAMLALHECSISVNLASLMRTKPRTWSADDDSAVRQPFVTNQPDLQRSTTRQLETIKVSLEQCQSKMTTLQHRINDAVQPLERTSPDAQPPVAQGTVEAEHRRQRRISGVFDRLRAVKATSIDSPPRSRLSSLRTEQRTASIDITGSLASTSRPILPPRQRSDSLLAGTKRLSVPLAAIHRRVPSLKGRKLRAAQASTDPSSKCCASSSIGNGGQSSPSTESASSLLASASRKREGVLWLASKRALSITNEEAPLNSALPSKESWVVLAGTGHLTENDHWRVNDADRSHSGSSVIPSMIDLRLATVRRARGLSAGSFAFEVVTTDGKRKLYQATSEQETQLWMASIGLAIESLFNGASSIRRIDRASASLAEMSNAEAARPNSIYSSGQNPLWTQSLIDLTERPTLLSPTKLVSTGANFLKHARRRSRVDSSLDRPVAASIMEAAEPIAEIEVILEPTQISSSFSASSASGSSPLDRTSSLETNRISWAISDSIPSSLLQERAVEFIEMKRPVSNEPTLSDLDDADRRIAEMVNERYGGRSRSMDCSRVETLARGGPAPELAEQGTILVLPFPSQVQRSQSTASSGNSKSSLALEIDHLSRLPENSSCADCCAPNPRWTASLSCSSPPGCLIFICITCAGQHRSLGVAISRVKSVDLDEWNDEWLQRARDWGNSRANDVWKAKRDQESKSAGIRGEGDFWKMKYVDEVWKVGKEEAVDL